MGLTQINILVPKRLADAVDKARGKMPRSQFLRQLLLDSDFSALPLDCTAPPGPLRLIAALVDEEVKDAVDSARGHETTSSFLKRYLWWRLRP